MWVLSFPYYQLIVGEAETDEANKKVKGGQKFEIEFRPGRLVQGLYTFPFTCWIHSITSFIGIITTKKIMFDTIAYHFFIGSTIWDWTTTHPTVGFPFIACCFCGL